MIEPARSGSVKIKDNAIVVADSTRKLTAAMITPSVTLNMGDETEN
jgi:hypothetical protein